MRVISAGFMIMSLIPGSRLIPIRFISTPRIMLIVMQSDLLCFAEDDAKDNEGNR